MDKERSVAGEINRELFLNPSLIGDGESSPLLDRARELVEEEVQTAHERKEHPQDDRKRD